MPQIQSLNASDAVPEHAAARKLVREQEEQARRPGFLAGAAHVRAERAQDYRQHRTGAASSARKGTQKKKRKKKTYRSC